MPSDPVITPILSATPALPASEEGCGDADDDTDS